MNTVIKGCIIGAVFYEAFKFVCRCGMGYILGILAKYNLTADEAIEILSAYKHPSTHLVAGIAKFLKKSL